MKFDYLDIILWKFIKYSSRNFYGAISITKKIIDNFRLKNFFEVMSHAVGVICIGLFKSGFENEFFGAKEFFYMILYFKNGC